MASPSKLSDGIALTDFIVAEDVERTGRFCREPTIVALANTWIIINISGGPTDHRSTRQRRS